MSAFSIKKINFSLYEFIYFFSLLLLLTLMLTKNSEAKVIYYGSEKEQVNLSYGGPTIFRFNEEVKTISQASRFDIHPADDADPNYSVLSVTPRFTSGKSDVTFILASGAIVNTALTVVPKAIPEKTDSFYDFKSKDSLIEGEKEGGNRSNVSEMELMKAMIRWDQVVGYKTEVLSKTIDTGIDDLSAKLVRVYMGAQFNGYIFEVKNTSNKRDYTIDLKNLSLGMPNAALISQVDREVLSNTKEKSNSTFVRIVAKPTSVYYNVHLPVAPIKAD